MNVQTKLGILRLHIFSFRIIIQEILGFNDKLIFYEIIKIRVCFTVDCLTWSS